MRGLNYNTVLFDLDGTLLNTLEDLADSVNELLSQTDAPVLTSQDVCRYIGNGARALLVRALNAEPSEEEVSSYLKKYKEIYSRRMLNKTKPYEGIEEVLIQLKKAEVKMAIVSNKPDYACKLLSEHYFSEYISIAVGEKAGIPAKPAPDMVNSALKLLDVSKEKCLYVGDSEVDIRTAKNAGLPCVAVCWGFRDKELLIKEGADFIIEYPRELTDIIGTNY